MPGLCDPARAPATAGGGHLLTLCPGCGAALAGDSDAIQIDGQTVSDRVNPAGVRHRLRFFARADGCAAGGEATDEDTWFGDHTWQRAFCRRCSRHVGWLFRHRTRAFWALSVDDAPATPRGG